MEYEWKMRRKNIQSEPLFRSVGDTKSVPEVGMATALDAEMQSECEMNTCKG